jgi:hypothetical protein
MGKQLFGSRARLDVDTLFTGAHRKSRKWLDEQRLFATPGARERAAICVKACVIL